MQPLHLRMNTVNKKLCYLAILAVLSGCETVTPNQSEIKQNVNSKAQQAVNQVVEDAKSKSQFGLSKVSSLEEVPTLNNTQWDADKGNYSISSVGNLSDIIEIASKNTGYKTIMYVEGVDKYKPVSISLSSVSPEFAIKKIAWAAGYIAVIDKKSKSVTITDQAVYTFKLNSQVFNQLVQTVSSNFSSGSGGSSSGSSLPGIGGGNSGGGTSQFNVSGKSGSEGSAGGLSAGSNSSSGVTKFIQSLVGKNADVSVSEEMGLITVRSNAVALERLHQTLNKMAEVSSRRVAVEATFVEVSLGDTFEYGIDWTRILSRSGQKFGINGGASASLATASVSYQYTHNSISSIVTALKSYTNVTVMSQPKIETGNRIPTTFFDGYSLPYLGNVQSVQQQTSTSTSGTVSYADDGVRLSFVPDIVSDSQVQFLLLPSLNSVGAERVFDIGGGTKLTDFVRSKKEALLTVDIEDGQTAIIGGLRTSKDTGNQTGLPGVTRKLPIGSKQEASAREVVLLLHANVIPGRTQDTLFAESL